MATWCHPVAIGIGDLTLHLEVREVRNDRHPVALRHLRTDLVVHIGQDCLARRTDLRILQDTLRLCQTLTEDVQLKCLHLIIGIRQRLLIHIFLLILLQLQEAHVVIQLHLTHLVGRTCAKAIEITLVAQLYLLAVQLHARDLQLHLHLRELAAVLDGQLFQLQLLHLLLVELLLVVGFRAQQVESQDRRTHIHRVATLLIHLHDAGVDRRVDDLLKRRYHLTRSTHRHLDRPLIDRREQQVFPCQTRLHQAHHATHHDNSRHNACTNLYPLFPALSLPYLFWYFSVHIYGLFLFSCQNQYKIRAKIIICSLSNEPPVFKCSFSNTVFVFVHTKRTKADILTPFRYFCKRTNNTKKL